MTRDEALIEFVRCVGAWASLGSGLDQYMTNLHRAADALLAELAKGANEPDSFPVYETVYDRPHEYVPSAELADLRRKAKALETLADFRTSIVRRGHGYWAVDRPGTALPAFTAPDLVSLAEKLQGGE